METTTVALPAMYYVIAGIIALGLVGVFALLMKPNLSGEHYRAIHLALSVSCALALGLIEVEFFTTTGRFSVSSGWVIFGVILGYWLGRHLIHSEKYRVGAWRPLN